MRTRTRREPRLILNSIRIEGFKSLEDVILEFDGKKPLVLVGPNGSGKTNIVELFYFLRRALYEEPPRRPYAPHAPWGQPRNLTWEGTGAPIRVSLFFDTCGCSLSEGITYSVTFSIEDELSTLVPVYEKIKLEDYGIVIERRVDKIITSIKMPQEKVEEFLLKISSIIGKKGKDYSLSCSDDYCRIIQKIRTNEPPVFPIYLSYPLPLNAESTDQHLDVEFFMYPQGCCVYYIITPQPLRECEGIRGLFRALDDWFRRIVVLRQVNYSEAKTPHSRRNESTLSLYAENLAEILYNLLGKRRARERIEAALGTLFPWLRLRVEFNQYGQIEIKFVEKRGDREISLHYSMVPDGVIKLLAIEAAIALNPSLLAIDEIENSLHARIIQYLMSEFEDVPGVVIIATHSPVVVDAAGPERTIVVSRNNDGMTVVKRIEDPKELLEKLKEAGITLSDYIIYA